MTESDGKPNEHVNYPSGEQMGRLAPALADQLRQAIPSVPASVRRRLLELTKEVAGLSSAAASELLRSCALVCSRVGAAGFESWCREGLEVLRRSEQSGIAYFRLGTGRSADLLDQLSSGVQLASVKTMLETYCLALTGRKTPIVPSEGFRGLWAGQGFSTKVASSQAVFLPAFADVYASKPDNLAFYKVMATHQAGHMEFGSYQLRGDGLAGLCRALDISSSCSWGGEAPSGLMAFLGLFPNRRLAADMFIIVEDSRIDFLIRQQYRGISGALDMVQREALGIRPPLTSLSLREALVEMLVRMSLGGCGRWLMPAALRTPVAIARAILRSVLSPHARVEDSAAAAARLYRLAEGLPGAASDDSWVAFDLEDERFAALMPSPGEIDGMLRGLPDGDGDALSYTSPAPVQYRGIFGIDGGQGAGQSSAMEEIDAEAPVISNKAPAEGETDGLLDVGVLAVAEDDPAEGSLVFGANDVNQEDALLVVSKSGSDEDSSQGALERDGPFSFLYNEWDFRAGDYRLRWCRVRQIALDEGTPDFFEATLDEHSRLVAQIGKQFEMLKPESSRRVKRLPDGEDFDLDAVVDFIIARKAGHSRDAKVYWRRNKTERDVSVAFLLDMSSSTIEYINRMQGEALSPFFPRDYKDYFEWLQSTQGGKVRPKEFKRIIDLEKESTVLLIKSLEAIGDRYGIYGFSGSGRENVEFYVVKDLDEEFSERIKSRIDRIEPKRGTRMGPAIRHATWKLDQQDSKSKFLFLISDGRPEDHGYGKDGLEREYAINDTRMALLEARGKGIVPFCLTFDRAGHDYLRTIRRDMSYEVLADIESLPVCLPSLYGRFTR